MGCAHGAAPEVGYRGQFSVDPPRGGAGWPFFWPDRGGGWQWGIQMIAFAAGRGSVVWVICGPGLNAYARTNTLSPLEILGRY